MMMMMMISGKTKKVKKRYAQKCRYIVCGIRAVSPEEGKP